MKRRTFYWLIIWLPLIVPIILFGLEVLLKVNLPGALSGILFSTIIYGIPYLLFASAISIWARKISTNNVKRISWILPILFLPVMIIVFGFLSDFNYISWNNILSMFAEITEITLIFGYGYILFACVIEFTFKKIGWIINE
jgi:hypothetical protein